MSTFTYAKLIICDDGFLAGIGLGYNHSFFRRNTFMETAVMGTVSVAAWLTAMATWFYRSRLKHAAKAVVVQRRQDQ